jgi:hypothetical protein
MLVDLGETRLARSINSLVWILTNLIGLSVVLLVVLTSGSHVLHAMGLIIVVLFPDHRINILAVNAHFEEKSVASHNVRIF